MKTITADEQDSFSGRARDSVTGWWGRSRRFLSEVRNEMGRVTWPSQEGVVATTVVVILTSIFFGVYLWLVDLGLSKALTGLYHAFGAA
jgi:preprotein translocase subunit SecE